MVRTLVALVATLISGAHAIAAPPLEIYASLPGVDLMRLSASGERFAFIGQTGEQRRLVVAEIGGKPLLVSNIGDKKVRDLYWADEDHLLVEYTSTFSAPLEFQQAYELSTVLSIRISDQKGFPIFQKQESVADAVFGYYGSAKVDGHLVGFFGGITYEKERSGTFSWGDGYPDLYKVDLDTQKAQLISKGQYRRHSWVVGADGAVVAHTEYDTKTGRWRLYEGLTRDKLLMEKITEFDDVDVDGEGRTPGSLLLLDDSGDEDISAELSIADVKQERLFAEKTVHRYLRDPDTGRLIGCTMQEAPYAMLFDRTQQARFNGSRKAFPGLQMNLVSWSRNFDRLIVKTDGGQDSGTFWLVDIASGNATELGWEYPKVHLADVAHTEMIKYQAADGLAMEGVLTLPPGHEPKNLPVVVMPHGGPIGVRDTVGFDWWAQAYAAAGYAVFQPNYRGSSGYGTDFRGAGFGEFGRKMQTDLSDGLAALAKQGTVDPKRACIVGGSYGGYAALAGVTLQHGLYRCAVSVAGVSDLPYFFSWQADRYGYKSDATRYWRALIGTEKNRDIMPTISPARNAGQADAPVLLIHGKDDTVVPFDQSYRMASALKGAGKPVELIAMKGEDHWLSREETRTTMLKAAMEFVKAHNPP